MADNIAVTAGSGTSVATDDISGVHYQRTKLSLGADGSAVDAVAGAGAVGTGVQRMTLASDDPGVVALQLIDNIVSGSGANISQVGGVAPSLNTGVRDAGTRRVTLATDDVLATVTTLTGSAIAHDAADSGNPHKIGLHARTSWPSAVANADRVNAIGDKYGRMIVTNNPRDLRSRQVTTISNTDETTIVTAGAAGVFCDVFKLVITNTSGTACNVTIKDATAGTTVETFAVAAGSTSGFCLPSSDAMKQTTAANAWTATCSASVSSILITAHYVNNVDA